MELPMLRALIVAALFFIFPALVCATNRTQDPARGSSQTQNPASAPSPTAAQTPTSPKPRPKKVWTEENLGEASGTISIVGTAPSASKNSAQPRQPKATSGKSSDGSVDAQTLAKLRRELQRLQWDLAIVDRQLRDLKDFSKGDSKNAGNLQSDPSRYSTSSLEEQLRHLQEAKAKIQTAIDDLFDAARASGIEPGQLR
jgi:hypothetical protein